MWGIVLFNSIYMSSLQCCQCMSVFECKWDLRERFNEEEIAQKNVVSRWRNRENEEVKGLN